MGKREGNMQCSGSGEAWIIEKKSKLERVEFFLEKWGKVDYNEVEKSEIQTRGEQISGKECSTRYRELKKSRIERNDGKRSI